MDFLCVCVSVCVYVCVSACVRVSVCVMSVCTYRMSASTERTTVQCVKEDVLTVICKAALCQAGRDSREYICEHLSSARICATPSGDKQSWVGWGIFITVTFINL